MYEIFAKLLEEKGLIAADVCRGTGLPSSLFSEWKRGKSTPKQDKLQKIADFFGVSLEYLTTGKNRDTLSQYTRSKGVEINVVGRVAAGIPIEAIENIIDTEEIPQEMALCGDYFGLKIKGDSMEPDIHNEDTVIIRKQPDAESGEIVVALINGNDGCCKKLRKYEDGSIALLSLNPKYEPMYFKCSEINTIPVTILGKVVELRRKF